MAFDLATISNILKTVYLGPVRDQLNNATVLLSELNSKKRKYVGGKEAYFPLRKGRNVGMGARPEDMGTSISDLPEPGNQQYDKSIYRVVYDYAMIKITGPGMSHTKSDQGSFVRGLQSEMEGAIQDKKVDTNRMVWHDGSSFLTRCGVTAASTSVVVESTKFLEPGMLIDVVQLADGLVDAGARGRSVVSITSATVFVISGAAITTSAVDGVLRHKARQDPTVAGAVWGKQVEPWGLEALVNNVDVTATGLTDKPGDIARAGNAWWQSTILANGAVNRALSLDLMQQAFDETDIASDFIPGLILTSYGGKREYAKLLVSDKRYPPGGDITLDGGYKALEFNGVPLVAEKDASLTLTPQLFNRMYFLTLSSMNYFVNKEWEWIDDDGSTLSRVNRKDSFEAILRGYYNIIILHPNRNAILADITGA